MKTVGIIGASGIIGSIITKRFLQEGYKVRVSASEIARIDKYQHFDDLPEAKNLEIMQMIVNNKRALKKFLNSCEVVIHGGTPFLIDIKKSKLTENDLRAKETQHYLEVILEMPNLDRVILLESVNPFDSNYSVAWDDEIYLENIDEAKTRFINVNGETYKGVSFKSKDAIQDFVSSHSDYTFKLFSVSPILNNSNVQTACVSRNGLDFLMKEYFPIKWTNT